MALCEWVKRADRFHWPRHPDEPDIDELEKSLDLRDPPLVRMKQSPQRILRFLTMENADTYMAELPEDVREAVTAWAQGTFVTGNVPPSTRRWWAIEGAGEALVDWLKRHGLFHAR